MADIKDMRAEFASPALTGEQIEWSDRVKADAQIALHDLGIDLPFSRWRDACKYIKNERERALVVVRTDTLEVLYLAKAKSLARRRMKAMVNGVSPEDPFDALPTRAELVEAKLWIEQTFGGGHVQ